MSNKLNRDQTKNNMPSGSSVPGTQKLIQINISHSIIRGHHSTYCSDMCWFNSSYIHGNVISELSENFILFHFYWRLYHLTIVTGKILLRKLVNELDITVLFSRWPKSWHFMIRKLFHIIFNLYVNKANSTNLYPPTKGYLRETCKSQNIYPIYLTLSSPTVSFRS